MKKPYIISIAAPSGAVKLLYQTLLLMEQKRQKK